MLWQAEFFLSICAGIWYTNIKGSFPVAGMDTASRKLVGLFFDFFTTTMRIIVEENLTKQMGDDKINILNVPVTSLFSGRIWFKKWGEKMYKRAIDEIRQKHMQEHYTVSTVCDAAKKIHLVKDVGTPVKIIEICNNMGFSVFQQELPQRICGYIAIDGELKDRFDTDRIISVNRNESGKRRRFTVAHEIGHFLFDFDPNKIEFYNAFEHDHDESEAENEKLANRFAAELLMPADKFEKEYYKIFNKHNGSSEQLYETIQDLSDKFLVPPKAVERRIKEELKLHE